MGANRRNEVGSSAHVPSAYRWSEPWVAQAFADQRYAKPYRQMLKDIVNEMDPSVGPHWLDLGCGSGRITEEIWKIRHTQGKHVRITGLDCSAEAGRIYLEFARQLQPLPQPGEIEFIEGDISCPLPLPNSEYDGVVASLVLSYAEHWDPFEQAWTQKTYSSALQEACRILRPSGQLVATINVPDPDFFRIARESWREYLTRRGPRLIKNASRMLAFGRWLKECASIGRYHYLPAEEVAEALENAGFSIVTWKKTYADQAYVFNCRK